MTQIDVVVFRDPDGPTEVSIYVDGKGMTGDEPFTVHVVSLDPGAGYDRESWEDQRDSAAAAVHPGLAEQVREWYDEIGEDSPYVEED